MFRRKSKDFVLDFQRLHHCLYTMSVLKILKLIVKQYSAETELSI